MLEFKTTQELKTNHKLLELIKKEEKLSKLFNPLFIFFIIWE